MNVPQTRYAKSGDVHIAYLTAGDGPFDLVYVPGWVSHVKEAWEVRCAIAAGEAVRQLGLEIRAGVHTGEVELAGAGVRGMVVHVGARIAASAQPGEVLVSRTVKDRVGFGDRIRGSRRAPSERRA